jgi:hypothetical protein
MLTIGRAHMDRTHIDPLAHRPNLLKPHGPDRIGVTTMAEDRHPFRDNLLRHLVEMVRMQVGDEHRLDTVEYVLDRQWQVDQGRLRATGIAAPLPLLSQPGVDQEVCA